MAEPNDAPPKDPKGSPSSTRTDLEALQGSGRSKVILLAGMLVVALGIAAWFFVRSGGVGNSESPGRVLVVSNSPFYKAYLLDLGFEVDLQTFDHLKEKARTEVDDLDGTGVEAIMIMADHFGYGYVVFDSPEKYDFSELDVEGDAPTFSGGELFAVISVGDLAFPNKVTAGAGLLESLFEQDRLAEILPPKQPPTVEALQLKDQLRLAIERLTEAPSAAPLRSFRDF